ncbi:hypothetical protein ACF046_13645 [Glutamicibacter creatinolyticus]|uniref:hypothetical protein n=1 Tax=Glutamicibacter creatinolyticus TaxID=162496 RepID=UPI0033F9A983
MKAVAADTRKRIRPMVALLALSLAGMTACSAQPNDASASQAPFSPAASSEAAPSTQAESTPSTEASPSTKTSAPASETAAAADEAKLSLTKEKPRGVIADTDFKDVKATEQSGKLIVADGGCLHLKDKGEPTLLLLPEQAEVLNRQRPGVELDGTTHYVGQPVTITGELAELTETQEKAVQQCHPHGKVLQVQSMK